MNAKSPRHLVAIAIAAVLTLGGCSAIGVGSEPPKKVRPQDSNLVSQSYEAADALLARAPYLKDGSAPLLVASFVNINSLENSSALGRMIAEQVGARFAQQGFIVKEMKLRDNVYIQENAGEFALSRSVQNLSQTHNAAAVVAGTYAVGRQSVFINARLIRAADGVVLSAYDYVLPLGPDTRALVASQ